MNKKQIVEILKNKITPRGSSFQAVTIRLLEETAEEILALLVNQSEFEHFSAGYEFGKSGKFPWQSQPTADKPSLTSEDGEPIHLGSFIEGWNQGVETTRYAVAREVFWAFISSPSFSDGNFVVKQFNEWLDRKAHVKEHQEIELDCDCPDCRKAGAEKDKDVYLYFQSSDNIARYYTNPFVPDEITPERKAGEPEDLRTSAEWTEVHDFNVLDPDGWDRKNFQHSWFEEKITFDEYESRAIKSTCSPWAKASATRLGKPGEPESRPDWLVELEEWMWWLK